MFHLADKQSSVAIFTEDPIQRPNRLLSNDSLDIGHICHRGDEPPIPDVLGLTARFKDPIDPLLPGSRRRVISILSRRPDRIFGKDRVKRTCVVQRASMTISAVMELAM
jgi:hypothetical protein